MWWPASAKARKVAAENSDLPMKTTRSAILDGKPARRGLVLGQLPELAHHHVALELGDVVDEQHAVQVVDLVLEAGRHQPVGFQRPLLAVAVEIGDRHRR